MTNPKSPPSPEPVTPTSEDAAPPSVLVFNASDPTGAGGVTGDVLSIASVGGHALPVVTGAYVRDTTRIFDFFALEEEAVTEQARAILEDAPVQVIKVGFAGSPENVSAIAELASDYSEVPLITWMPDLSWWEEGQIDTYQDAVRELLLPQTTVLVGNHSTLWRWLLPDWTSDKTVRARPARHPRRRQLAGARLPRRGRHAALHRRAQGPYMWDAEGTSATSTTSAPGAR
jgi:hydroxymethylpyrimidine/phosphomethylpyrimidine kinase